jgi:hypothetical protein
MARQSADQANSESGTVSAAPEQGSNVGLKRLILSPFYGRAGGRWKPLRQAILTPRV